MTDDDYLATFLEIQCERIRQEFWQIGHDLQISLLGGPAILFKKRQLLHVTANGGEFSPPLPSAVWAIVVSRMTAYLLAEGYVLLPIDEPTKSNWPRFAEWLMAAKLPPSAAPPVEQ